jgi:hypothetical protein
MENKSEVLVGGFASGPPPASGPRTSPAYCPKCKGVVVVTDPTCSHCGYDFPFGPSQQPFRRSESIITDAILFLGTMAALFLAITFIVFAILALADGNGWLSLLLVVIAVFLMAGGATFLRLLRYGPP